MIVLDTNIISEFLKETPAPQVVRWLEGQARSAIFSTSVSQAAILYGINLLPPGRRQSGLEEAASRVFLQTFAGRLLAFDSDAARAYSVLVADRRRAGRPISFPDAQIAAIARSRGAAVATRNIRDFQDLGVALIDPWQTET